MTITISSQKQFAKNFPPRWKMLEDNAERARQRKIAKDQRRKQYHDLQVQGTNDSSIVSKRLVEMLYTAKLRPQETHWFKAFVPRLKQQRLPSINRGYLIRMESVRRNIELIINQYPHTPRGVRIVNLGCGFDPLAFQLLEQFGNRIFFVDVDYPALATNKLSLMQQSREIMQLLGGSQAFSHPAVVMQTAGYALVGCDLKNLLLYESILHSVHGTAQVTIFIAEVSLAYMAPQDADQVIECLSRVPSSHILVLEQILAYGPHHIFARKMLAHFRKLCSPIQCVEQYPSRQHQHDRFSTWFTNVNINDLYQEWQRLPLMMRQQIQAIEDFDEWEEFILFCHHYVLVHASNDERFYTSVSPQLTQPLETHSNTSFVPSPENLSLQLKFPAVCALENNIFLHGGANQCRLNRSFLLDANNVVIEIENEGPGPRMCHSATAMDGGVLVVGGRSRPRDLLADTFYFKNKQWLQMDLLSNPRSRHCAVAIDRKNVLVFGGMSDCNGPLFESFNMDTKKWQPVPATGNVPPNLKAAAMAYNHHQKYGIIVGGYHESIETEINDTAYKFFIDGTGITLTTINLPKICSRIGSKIDFVSSTEIIIVGGIAANPQSMVCTVDTVDGKLNQIACSENSLLIGHGMGMFNVNGAAELRIVGGGAVCYLFGSAYSETFHLKLV